MAHLTGVSVPYERRSLPVVSVRTDRESVSVSLGRIVVALEERGLLEAELVAARASLAGSTRPS
jgi:regulator of sirC expression with transglutaminase-like and TPR domain